MGCCDRILEVINITVVPGVSVTLEVAPIQQFLDHGWYELEIPQSLPPMVGIEAVFILADGVTYYTLDKFGDILRAGKLRGHKCGKCAYRIVYGADGIVSPDTGSGNHFVFWEGLCSLRFSSLSTLFNPLSIITNPNVTTTKEPVTV